ncbi:MAG: hypothetical protein MN733_31790 [Nitrososphaera sp.]|nr:hypothetical protein [Nitrososphaera sp.]
MKLPFNKNTFVSGTSAAYVEKHGAEYPVKFAGMTNLGKFPMTVTIGQGNDPDYGLMNVEGVLNTGETCYMKKTIETPAATMQPGSPKGWINIYKNDEGKLVVGTRIHATEATAKAKAKNAESIVVASGVSVTW